MVVHDPDLCLCFECSLRRWDRSFQEEELALSRVRTPTIEVRKNRNAGEMPPFLGVIHRHFEKAIPISGSTNKVTLIAPLEMLEFLIPQALVNGIESVQIVYEKAATK
jgi:hypothetical protein